MRTTPEAIQHKLFQVTQELTPPAIQAVRSYPSYLSCLSHHGGSLSCPASPSAWYATVAEDISPAFALLLSGPDKSLISCTVHRWVRGTTKNSH